MKYILTLLAIMFSYSANAQVNVQDTNQAQPTESAPNPNAIAVIDPAADTDDISGYTSDRIRSIYNQAVADLESLEALEKELDIKYEETLLIEKNLLKEQKEMQEMDLRGLEQSSKDIDEATQRANIVVKEVEERIQSQSNKRQGFGKVE